MKSHLRTFSVIALILFGFFATNAFSQVELVSNGEFDEGETGWGGWIDTGSATVTASIDTNSVLSGKNSYLIDVTTGSAETWRIQRNTPAPLAFGKKYTISFWAVADKPGASINVLLEEIQDPYAKQVNEFAVLADTAQYFEFVLDFCQITDATNELKLHFGGDVNDSTNIWVDAVSVLEEASEGATLPEGNILSDPEYDMGNLTAWDGWIDTDNAASVASIDTNGVLSGKNSMAITTNGSASADTWRVQRNILAPIKFGHKYTVGFYAVSDKDSTSINVLFEENGDPYDKRINETPYLSTTPQYFEFVLEFNTVTDPTNYLKLHFGGANNDSSTIWVDAVSVVEEKAGMIMLPAENMVTNAEFDSAMTDWSGWIDTGSTDVTASIDTTGVLSGPNSMKLEIIEGGADMYRIQRNTTIPLEFGYRYSVSFLAVADKDSVPVNILLEEIQDPFAKQLTDTVYVMTDPMLFTAVLDSNAYDDATNELKLHFGLNDSVTIWVDAVSVVAEKIEGWVVGVAEEGKLPNAFSLSQNYPNPFNPETNIFYSLQENTNVTIRVYNVLGQVVATLVDLEQPAGKYTLKWNGLDSFGNRVSSGMYIYQMKAGSFISSRKMMLMK